MNGFIRFRPTDVLNLLVTRGASYLVAMIVLYFASLSLKGEAFIGFVFWWSLGLMFGALLLGSVSIASARSVVTSGDLVPPVSVLGPHPRIAGVSPFPCGPIGPAALAFPFLMAATSHDFWLANLTPPVWKALHMLVYAAYGLVVLHVALGALQAERSPVLAGLLLASVAIVVGLHLAAARHEAALDAERTSSRDDGFVDVCAVDDIPEDRARIATLGGERVAVFRHDGRVSAISNLCRHQNGPLGEGRIVDGCVTCPWHGYQYDPASGRAPKPFTEKVPTFDVRVEHGRVLVHPRPHPPGTRVEPARIAPARDGGARV